MRYVVPVDPAVPMHLHHIPTDVPAGLHREEAEARTEALGGELGDLADLLFAAGAHGLLVVLQGLDTSGKDGTIRHLLRYINAQSCRVVPFKVPTELELSHDFLWRVHQQVPGRGSIAIFNRSHYEDVLVVRVRGLAPEHVWRGRYDHINAFEALLTDSDVLIAKFYLHISPEEQERRLLEREAEVEKSWKLNVEDWKDRALWDEFRQAYEEALRRCSTPRAPSYVVPADHKWYRNLAVTDALVELLRPHKRAWLDRLEHIGIAARKEIEEYRRSLQTP